MLFVERKYELSLKRNEIENGKSNTQFLRDDIRASARIRIPN